MSKQKKRIFVIFIGIAIILFLFILDFLLRRDNREVIYNIAYISDTRKSEDIKVIAEGISQAAKDMRVEVKSYVLANNNEVEAQIELIKKEVKGKVDAILLNPTDSNKLSETIKKAYKDVPIVLINSAITGFDSIPIISCDNEEVGKEIAYEIIRNGNTRNNIGIIVTNKNKSNLQDMYRGFLSEISYSKNNCKELNIGENINTYSQQINSFIKSENIDVLVTFERDILEELAQIKKENKLELELYGMGRTNKILSYLEEDIINSVAVQNEFNLGYLGVKIAVDKLNNKDTSSKTIDFSIINKSNMYWDDNQKILFPFIK
ncbi:substrate-binding domain-containing protein [Clostridium paraputrificum]|uniref:substrate-binding domain-containing protein n=1 Tax=Clostridium paraputrificum TaxID=29363 RepID=UPI00232C8093|nr:substrate-binding domain-containing protein [Clostridium paraputrificum]MDB2106270.1 substrate-binding domain-containing protein [Clostridium paraputrificum]MDB2112961.1 substrate-binding domain-containing protein [Clostridium paraputrificum]